jgi:putative ABC transport system permease protein
VIRVALRGLAGRKLRAVLTSFAIVLGVAMVSGTFVLTDTIDKAFNNIFTESYANTDAVISGKAADISFEGESATRPSVPAPYLETVRSLPGVAEAAGSVLDDSATKILDNKGKAINTQGAPSFGFGIDPSLPRFNPLRLNTGRWPISPNETVIDAATADAQDYKVGDTVRIATLKPVRPFKLVGIAQYGSQRSLGSATFAVFTIPEAQELLERKGELDAISVAAKSSVSQQQLVDQIKSALPPDKAEVRTAKQQVREDKKQVSFTKIIKYLLLAFAGIALFVGAFVIFNTLSITIAQRIRELATLRTIGASRRQLLGSVALEALVIGALASIVGLLLGIGLAWGLQELFKAVNLDLPTVSLVIKAQTIYIALLIGIVVTLVAGLAPAIRATKVPPIAAVREGATLPPGRLAPYVPYIALLIVAVAVALLAYGMFAGKIGIFLRLISLAIGCLGLFVGVALMSPRFVPVLARFVRPIAKWAMLGMGLLVYPTRLGVWLVRHGLFRQRLGAAQRIGAVAGGIVLLLLVGPAVLFAAALILGWLGAIIKYIGYVAVGGLELLLLGWLVLMVVNRLRGQGYPSDRPELRFDPATDRLSGENARRNPGRTAATAAALMIGLALVTFIAVLANGMKVTNRGAITRQVKSDYMITSQSGFETFSPAAGDAIRRDPEAAVASDVRQGLAKVAGHGQQLTGIDPATVTKVYGFDWKKGSNSTVENLGGDAIILDQKFAKDNDLRLGDRVPVLTESNEKATFVVRGIYKAPPFYPLLGVASISKSRFDQIYERPKTLYTFVNAAGKPSDTTEASLKSALATFPDAKLQTRDAWIDAQDKDFDNFLIMLYVLLALAVIVSLFGMVNTLVLSVFERTRELGMLRAVGMTRNQVARMVRQESVITALIGAALGLPLGIFLAVLVTKALSQFETEFHPPWRNLVAFAIVAMIVGVVAAVAPARRASRLNVLRALQYE